MTNEQIKAYLREPATMQQKLNALAVHSQMDFREEDRTESVNEVRARYGLLDVPAGTGIEGLM